MSRVLIPFSDLRSGERAVRRLLAEPRDPALCVELMAIVDPLVAGKVAVFVSRRRAELQSRAAAERWLAQLEAMLESAGVQHRASVVVGPVRAALREAGARTDIDRVLLGARERDPLRKWRRQAVAHLMQRPLVSVT
jgi:nucleotide-binding universal stress UspA family protein